jgi:hypothetical protein
MSRADKKQRHRARREEKKKQQRKLMTQSPLRQIASASGEFELYAIGDLQRDGQISITGFKQAGPLGVIVAFLIDAGVLGRKDAWSRTGMTRMDLADWRKRAEARVGSPSRRIQPRDALALVVGAVKWSRRFDLRPPTDWMKVASALGSVPSVDDADVSAFRPEFAGRISELRKRLTVGTAEAFLARPDVTFILRDEDEPTWDDDEDDDDTELGSREAGVERLVRVFEQFDAELRPKVEPVVEWVTQQCCEWLVQQGQTPSHMHADVWRDLICRMVAENGNTLAGDNALFDAYSAYRLIRVRPEELADYATARDQGRAFTSANASVFDELAERLNAVRSHDAESSLAQRAR